MECRHHEIQTLFFVDGAHKHTESWSAANGGLRDGGVSKSEDIRGKRPFSSVFWISQVLFAPSGKGRKRQKKGEKRRFRPISRQGGQTVTPPFAAAQVQSDDKLKSTIAAKFTIVCFYPWARFLILSIITVTAFYSRECTLSASRRPA